MRLSVLQQFILLSCDAALGKRKKRKGLEQFYAKRKGRPSKKDAQNAVTRSIERLIEKELLVGYGVRTPHKWYIKEIRLTAKGRKIADQLLRSQQPELPFRKR
jgi:transposase